MQILKSPFASVSDHEWTEYVKRSVFTDAKSPELVGAFRFSYAALKDQGIVETRKENNRVVVEWKAPFQDFLKSISMQYSAFRKRAIFQHGTIVKRYSDKIGADIDGNKVSISGLMGLTHRLGFGGFESWLNGDRLTYATENFKRLNGIF